MGPGGHLNQLGRTLRRPIVFVGLATVLLYPSLAAAQDAQRDNDLRTAELTPGTEILREADLPEVLTPADIDHYRRIFALQDTGKWQEADREIGALHDKLLLGEVLAERYRDAHYHASYDELAHWLALYGDEPDAKAIYAEALSRRPKGAPAPTRPYAGGSLPQFGDDADIEPRPGDADPGLSDPSLAPPTAKSRAGALAAEIRSYAGSEPRRAELLLAGMDAKKLLATPLRDQLRAAIAQGYLAAGEAEQALALSAATEGAAFAPIAHWNAGLAAWRLGRLDEARLHFQALARSPGQSTWTNSAAAFWAARVELRARRPENYAYWLRIAAEKPRTFYGLLARRLLGVDPYLSVDADPFTEFDAELVGGITPGRRALGLLAVGQTKLAEAELHLLAGRGSPPLVQSLAALADRANLPGLSLQLAGALTNADGRHHDHALYPVPRWTPRGGFTVDRALIFALMRQESQFAPHARNVSGATGLMQLMPATARSMAERAGVALKRRDGRAERIALTDPEFNLTLAQKYVELLLHDDHIKGNLLLFAVAYNAGPGALTRLEPGREEFRRDPLLFLESIPAVQPRQFALHVLTNYWIYRLRLGQPSPDLDALAAGHWPTYTALDSTSKPGASHVATR